MGKGFLLCAGSIRQALEALTGRVGEYATAGELEAAYRRRLDRLARLADETARQAMEAAEDALGRAVRPKEVKRCAASLRDALPDAIETPFLEALDQLEANRRRDLKKTKGGDKKAAKAFSQAKSALRRSVRKQVEPLLSWIDQIARWNIAFLKQDAPPPPGGGPPVLASTRWDWTGETILRGHRIPLSITRDGDTVYVVYDNGTATKTLP